MFRFAVVAGLLAVFSVTAQAAKPCEALKGEIAAKLDAKGVQRYVLTIVPADATGDQAIVGSCDGGKSKITYVRGRAAPADGPATEAAATP
ncbi:MAG TPA: DUF1161 domain-containing protein [Solimonas sp.]